MGIKAIKEKVPVIVMTTHYRLEGEMHVAPGGRLLDEINREREFLPVTNVTIYDLNGDTPIDTLDFLAVNRAMIIILAPAVSA